jgi:membrane-associated phospholipid phosphatase
MDAAAAGPRVGRLDPSAEGRQGQERSLARRWRNMRTGVPPLLFLVGWAVVILALWVGLGCLLIKVGSHNVVGQTDRTVSRWFSHHRNHDLNETTGVTTYISETVTVVIVGLIAVVGARLAWKRWREALLVVAAITGEVVIFLGITLLVHRPRPRVHHLDIAPPTSSFPSGHTAAAVVRYGALALLASERFRRALVRWLFTAFAFLAPVIVGLSRLYRGMHFPTDVLAGALLGGVWLVVALKGVRLGVVHRALHQDSSA